MLQSKLNVLGQARYLGSHQTCGRVCAIAMLLNGKLLKEQYPVTAHAPNFDFWTGCHEIKRCEESKRTLKNPFTSRLAGIQESAYDWFESYLNNRTQKCVVNGLLSKLCSLGCGVPQGTILGPLLFFIYINDLPNCLSFCQPRMYADDTHITYASAYLHSMQSSLNRDLSNIHKWLLCNKLTLNSTKTEFMLIGSRQKLSTLSESLELSIDNIPIKQVSTTKSLGTLIDNNIYNSLVQPHFDYCSIVRGYCGKTLSERLQKLQNRAARILTSSSYDADAR